MKNFSREYISSLCIVIISLASMFGYTLGNDFVVAVVTVILGSVVAYYRFKKGDIRISGLRKE